MVLDAGPRRKHQSVTDLDEKYSLARHELSQHLILHSVGTQLWVSQFYSLWHS